jgi:hypothetical protein
LIDARKRNVNKRLQREKEPKKLSKNHEYVGVKQQHQSVKTERKKK